MKFLRKGFLLLLAVVLVLGGAFTFLFQDRLFAAALARYGPAALGTPLAFADADLDLLAGRAEVRELRLGPPDDAFLAAGQVVADASPWDLLAGRLRIRELALRGARLRLEVDEEGRLSIDPGPPPPGTPASEEADGPPPGADVPPAERDIAQILGEYWDRIQRYREYYDRIGIFGGGGEGGEPEGAGEAPGPAAPERGPAVPPWLQEEAEAAATAAGPWIGLAAIEDLSWETLDRRTGRPFLPAVESLTLRLERLGDPPPEAAEPGLVHGEGRLAGGGALAFDWQVVRDGGEDSLALQASDLPLDTLAHWVERSVPYRLAGGSVDLDTGDLRFSASSLAGTVRVVLRGVRLEARPGAPDVLGVSAADFAAAVNRAMGEHPVVLDFELSGRPTRPGVRLRARNLDEVLRGAVEAEVRARGEELLEEHAADVQDKARDLLGDRVPGAGRILEEGRKGLGGLLGGRDKGGGR